MRSNGPSRSFQASCRIVCKVSGHSRLSTSLYRLPRRSPSTEPVDMAALIPDTARKNRTLSTRHVAVYQDVTAHIPYGRCGSSAERCPLVGHWRHTCASHDEVKDPLDFPSYYYSVDRLAPERSSKTIAHDCLHHNRSAIHLCSVHHIQSAEYVL